MGVTRGSGVPKQLGTLGRISGSPAVKFCQLRGRDVRDRGGLCSSGWGRLLIDIFSGARCGHWPSLMRR